MGIEGRIGMTEKGRASDGNLATTTIRGEAIKKGRKQRYFWGKKGLLFLKEE